MKYLKNKTHAIIGGMGSKIPVSPLSNVGNYSATHFEGVTGTASAVPVPVPKIK